MRDVYTLPMRLYMGMKILGKREAERIGAAGSCIQQATSHMLICLSSV